MVTIAKKLAVLFIAVCMITFSNGYFSQPAEAAASEMYVNAKNDIILRTQPNKNAERLGTIKNHAKVTVLSSSNGWSLVQAGKSKGYVYTSALSKNNPKAGAATVTGGLTPVEGLVLTYSPAFYSDGKETYFAVKEDGFTNLYNKQSELYPPFPEFTYIENKDKLLFGVASSDNIILHISYPLKQGGYTINMPYDYKLKTLVENTTKTIKVKAGSFKNTIILREPDGSRFYLAKGVGVIKVTDKHGRTLIELAAMKQG